MYKLGNCKLVEKEHAEGKRQYAHVFHIRNQVCLARAFAELPQRYRLGILMHEYGHILAGPDGGELEANEALMKKTGIHVFYGPTHHGLGLEYMVPRDYERARGILQEVFQ